MTTSEQQGESNDGMGKCVHCQALTAEIDHCDRCDGPACDRCLERPTKCMVAPRHRLEELEGFLADSDDITLAALKEPADARAFHDGSRADDLLLEATVDMAVSTT